MSVLINIATGAAFLLSLSAVTVASAGLPASGVPTTRVVYGDLDLSRPDQRQVLRARVDAGAKDYCDQEQELTKAPSQMGQCLAWAKREIQMTLPHVARKAAIRVEGDNRGVAP